ncbi:copper chaperone PCu(A)C [Silicimonas sp. MF1-12-2]|uniref:copper chaperone PCu(A)C n=1 Tax=Silicimonas sp. MF1-12-2 TaxID=3384793 RepID=UPI0039B6AD96
MIRIWSVLLALLPVSAWSGELTVSDPRVLLAPPGARAHAAYFTLTNAGDEPRELIGIGAEGYAMAHLHRSEHRDGVATMSPIDALQVAPGQSVVLAPGGLHVMLMNPEGRASEGDIVVLTLEFSDGTSLNVPAVVTRMAHGS